MAYKISSFIIALFVVSGMAGFIAIFISHMGTAYAPDDYLENNNTIQQYNQLTALTSQTETIQNSTTEIKEKTGVLDVIGSIFSDAYRTLVITKSSVDVYDDMSDRAFSDSRLGASGTVLKVMITGIVLVAVFIGVLLSALVKKDL